MTKARLEGIQKLLMVVLLSLVSINLGQAQAPQGPAANTIVSGFWTTAAGDTLSYLDVYISTDGGMTFQQQITLPATSITGVGTIIGTYEYSIYLNQGDQLYTQFTSVNGVVTTLSIVTKK